MNEEGLRKTKACLSFRVLLAPQLPLSERMEPGQVKSAKAPELVSFGSQWADSLVSEALDLGGVRGGQSKQNAVFTIHWR